MAMDTYKPLPAAPKKPKLAPVRCHCCRATGFAACRVCSGTGKVMAGADRNGHPKFNTCEGCMGRKVMRCPTCHGQLFI
jgi:hypothetical protein